MEEFYLYLYCGESISTHVNNHPGDFVVDLPKTYLLEGRWECALTELTLHPQTERRTERLYLCSDLVQDSYLKNTFLPVLRSVDPTQEGTLDLEFGRPYYTRMRQMELNRVRIFIRDDRLQNRSTVLHASFEKTKMRFIEIYDHKNKRWVPYVPDYKKWEQHFTDVSEGRARADHRGRYLVGSGARWRPHTHKVEPDTT